jgi:hypothetical protein
MGSDLAAVSYLRSRIAAQGPKVPPTFGQLLFPALYLDPSGSAYINPEPKNTHRHLISLFDQHPQRIWTTNYDDLVEQAAEEAGVATRSLDASSRLENRGFAVAHLHGYLPPLRRQSGAGNLDPSTAAIVLAEDDYHLVATDVIGWTNREFFRLFDGHRVLILGMSLDDPNLRRVLQVTAVQSGQAVSKKDSSTAKHFAVMRALDLGDLWPDAPKATYGSADVSDAGGWRSWYWRKHGVDLIEIPTHDSILPFLMRLRYESHGNRPGELWREAASRCNAMNPWGDIHQGYARDSLAEMIQRLRRDFSVKDSREIAEVGIFLLKADASTLELAFRGGGAKRSRPGGREFSAHPDRPTGVAGRVFVSSDLVRITRNHDLYDYGLEDDEKSSSPAEFQGIISLPIVDWQSGGIPLGVIYVTTTTTSGALFNLPDEPKPGSGSRSLGDLYVWLHQWGLQFLRSLQ